MTLSFTSLIIPTFFAGVLTFLAPCTFPLVPAYLGFISGVSFHDLADPARRSIVRKKILINSLMYVCGFSVVFIFFGVLFGLGGAALVQYKSILQRLGGLLVLFFGLFMLGVFRLPWFDFLMSEKRLPLVRVLTPGRPLNSFLFGATFAFGWTPCIGPILGSVLTLAAASATVVKGAALLAVFSLGLAIPFVLIALGIGSVTLLAEKMERYLGVLSFIGGALITLLGILLLTDSLDIWLSWFYRIFSWIPYDRLLDYL